MIGDDIDEKQIAQILQDLTSQISADPSPDPSQLVCTVQSLLSSFRVQSWSAVGSFFRVGLKLLQQLTVLLGGSKSHVSDVRWPIYINAIIQFLDEDVSPWISSQGGWVSQCMLLLYFSVQMCTHSKGSHRSGFKCS